MSQSNQFSACCPNWLLRVPDSPTAVGVTVQVDRRAFAGAQTFLKEAALIRSERLWNHDNTGPQPPDLFIVLPQNLLILLEVKEQRGCGAYFEVVFLLFSPASIYSSNSYLFPWERRKQELLIQHGVSRDF